MEATRSLSLMLVGPKNGEHYSCDTLYRPCQLNVIFDDATLIFQEPLEQDVQRVAIKGLFKSVLEAARQRDEALRLRYNFTLAEAKEA
jgi:hypothetical protein